MATYTWNTTNGAFGTAANWSPSGVPGLTDTAVFASGTGTISGAGSVSTLQLGIGGPWTWTGTVTAANFNVNTVAALTTGATWTLSGTPSNGNYVVIGGGANGSGSLTISNGASLASTQTASTATYALFVGSGTVTNSNATLTVSGAGSSVNTGLNGAAIGRAGTGVMTVQSGASARFASSDSSALPALAVGFLAGSSGTVNILDSGSSMTANGFVTIGRGGAGGLTVAGNGSFTGGVAASGSAAAYGVAIGDASPSTSSTIVYGGMGIAQVSGGGTLHSLGSITIGFNGSAGSLTVSGSTSTAQADGTIQVGGGNDRSGGSGTLIVQTGGTVRSGTATTGAASIAIGGGMGAAGTVAVSGVGSLLDANGYRLSIGTGTTGVAGSAGKGKLTVSNGGRVISGSNYLDTEAALAIGAVAGSTGTLTVTGSNSTLVASGTAVIGGSNSGGGVSKGGTGTVAVTYGGFLQTGAMTIQTGSTLAVDQDSTLITPAITLNGGSADLYTLNSSTAITFGTGGVLTVHALSGTNTIGNFSFGDEIDFAKTTAVSIVGGRITTLGGVVTLGAVPAHASYTTLSDGNGGTIVTLSPQTIGVYRFFDSTLGTHFYTSSPSEAATVLATRSDLRPEGPGGIGLQAVSPAANDPNASPVYRFFDTVYGTHFFTASATERDQVIASRPDLTYEPNSSFYEHGTQEPGDTPVYRFFDSIHGTHFYSDSASEVATITATRPDLVAEGVGFYEPAQNYMTS